MADQRANRSTPIIAPVVWVSFALTALVVTGLSLWNFDWWVTGDNQRFVSPLGAFVSWAGLLMTLGGFILTLQQLMKVKGSAAAVELALAESRKSVAALTASGEVERAKLSIDAALVSARNGDSASLQDQLLVTRQCLFRIQERRLERFEDLQSEIASAIENIADTCDGIDEFDEGSVRKLSGWIRPHVDLIDKLQVRISEL